MPATGFTPIQLFHSSTSGTLPTTTQLFTGEVFWNIADNKVYGLNTTGSALQTIVGSLGNQNANSVAITGGSINATAIGNLTPSTGDFTSIILGTPLAVSYGGTGLSSLTQGYIPFGQGTSAFGFSSNLFWDNTNYRLGINRTPNYSLDVAYAPASGGYGGINLDTGTGTSVVSLYRTGSTYSYGGVGANQGWIYNNYGPLTIMSDGNYINFSTGPNGTPTEKARIFSSGGVSIGNTTDPGAGNLSVSGTITAAELATTQIPTASTTASNFSVPIILNGTTYYIRLSSTA